jgi:two-component system sensor histidine kinase YesM
LRIHPISLFRTVWRKINSKLFYKMVILYSLLTVIPLALVSTTFYLRSKSIFETRLLESRSHTLVETSDKIDFILKAVAENLEGYADDRVMISVLKNDRVPSTGEINLAERKSLESNLIAFLNFVLTNTDLGINYIDAIYLYNEAGKIYKTENATDPEFHLALTVLPFSQRDKPEWAFFVDHSRLVCSIQIIDYTTNTKLGYLSVMLKPEAIKELYASYPEGSFFITNNRNVILSAGNPESVGELFQARTSKQIVVNKRVSLYSGFVYFNVVSRSELYHEIIQLGRFAAWTTIASLGVVLLLTFVLLKRVTGPLRKLTMLMRKAEKEVFVPIKGIRSYDEIGILSESFNSLIAEVRDLIDKVYKAELYKKDAEIKAIKMYMSPHFLYNTLEIVGIIAKSPEGIKVVPEMVQTLSRILRFSITPGNDFISLKTEVQFVQWYMQLHQYRLGERLTFTVQVPEELLSVKVPKLILQPLVENAVIHGISQIMTTGHIEVLAYELDYDLILEVRDNGGGVTRQEEPGSIVETKDFTQTEAINEKKGLGTGLNQLETRIKLLYGARYGLEIIDTAGEGAVIRILLPMTFTEG